MGGKEGLRLVLSVAFPLPLDLSFSRPRALETTLQAVLAVAS